MNEINLFLGCDPDTKYQAYATIDLDDNVKAWVIRSKTSDELVQCKSHETIVPVDVPFLAVVEGQKIYPPKNGKFDKKSNPDSMIKLARASGIACSYLAKSPQCKGIGVALPQEWKGSVQKHAHQAQTLKKLGQTPIVKGSGDNRYCVPKDNFLDLSMTEYKHVVDAIGMAMWLRDQYVWKLKKEKILNDYKE